MTTHHYLFLTFGDHKEPTNGGAKFTQGILNILKTSSTHLDILNYYDISRIKNKTIRKMMAFPIAMLYRLPLPVAYFYSKKVIKELIEKIESTHISRHSNKDKLVILFIDHLELCYAAKTIRKKYGDKVKILHISHNCEPDLFKQRLNNNFIYKLSEHCTPYSSFEINTAEIVDGIISISETESRHFKSLADSLGKSSCLQVTTIPPSFNYSCTHTAFNTQSPIIKLAFIANFDWWPNVEAFNWIKNELAPVLPDNFQIHVYGKNSNSFSENAPANIVFHGFVENISDVWNNCFFSLAPIKSGAGVNIKVAESLYNKVPVLGTPLASQGISYHYLSGAICASLDPHQWIEILSLYLNDTEKYSNLTQSINYPSKLDIHDIAPILK
ncbi:glycosyltransferase family 4 protein [Pseudomonas jinjuensis]|uniref:Glycosyl transferases group 1 n=1 Tax=Pseudomonas jinjuensis TaxID=198616 RepID=A0A1H0AWD4_9PSED|nr:glycosyltransferase family 4 protein [Pseudomonas jinjuensis]SDN37780.1 Glycosyl transferases group 1 [Pseudomonas jinjuensis]